MVIAGKVIVDALPLITQVMSAMIVMALHMVIAGKVNADAYLLITPVMTVMTVMV